MGSTYLPKDKSPVIVIHEHRGAAVRVEIGEWLFLDSEHTKKDDIVLDPQLFQNYGYLPWVRRVGKCFMLLQLVSERH